MLFSISTTFINQIVIRHLGHCYQMNFIAYLLLQFYPFLSMGLIADCKLELSVHFIADPNYYPPPNEQNVKSYIAHAGMI